MLTFDKILNDCENLIHFYKKSRTKPGDYINGIKYIQLNNNESSLVMEININIHKANTDTIYKLEISESGRVFCDNKNSLELVKIIGSWLKNKKMIVDSGVIYHR